MAARVNTKFVFMLSAALILLVGGVGAYWFMFVHRDPEEMIQRGDQAFAAQQYDEAVEQYGRALRRRSNDTNLLEKYIAALEIAPVETELLAQRYAGQLQESHRLVSEQRRDDPEALEQYYGLLWQLARDNLASHSRIYTLSDRRLADDPDNVVARGYRGMTQTRRLTLDRSRADQLQAREDLEFALERRPNDTELMHHLALWKLFEANRLDRPAGNREQAANLRAEAVALSQQMLEHAPDDRQRQALHLRLLLDPTINEQEQARPVLDALEAQLLEDPQPRHVVLATVDMLVRSDRTPVEGTNRTQGVMRATQLLEAATQAYPDEAVYRLTLGRYMVALGERDEALDQFERTRQTAQRAPALAFLRWQQAGTEAAIQQADLLIGRIPQAESDQQREALRQEVNQILEPVRERVPDAPSLALLDGKLALLDGELGQAAIIFDQASERYDHRNPEPLRLAAHAHRRQGDWGAAAERLEQLLTLQPGRVDTHVELADIYLSGGQTEQAQQRLDAVLNEVPDHPQALRLKARLLSQQGASDEAIDIYRSLENLDDGQAVMELVQLYLRSDQQGEAVTLLNRRLEAAPNDLRALQALLALNDDVAEAEQLFEAALADGASEQAVSRLRRLYAGEEISVDEAMEEAIAAREDPIERALLRAEIARRRGDMDQFRAALDEAEQIDRHHPRVVEMQFDVALANEDWERAQRYAQAGRDRNLDLAEGEFYRGRLAAARGEFRTAVAHLRRGLSARPVYSDGWRYLGDAQRLNRDLDDAADAYRRAVEQRPNNVPALRGLAAVHDGRGEHDAALSRLREALQHQGNDPQLLEQYLQYEQQHGDVRQAIALRRQLAELASDQYDNRRTLAVLLARAGEADEAITTAEALIEDEGETRTNVALLAEVHRLADDAATGLATLENYIAQRGDEQSSADQRLLARYKLSINDGEGAVAAYEQAIALDDDPQQPAKREFADLLFDRGVFAEALPFYQSLHESMPEDTVVALRLAETHIQLGNPEHAEAILADAPESAERWALQAIVARAGGDLAGARQAIDRAIGRSDANALLYVERARIRIEGEDDRTAAASDLREALRLSPALLPARQMLVQLQLGRGDTAAAQRELRTMLSQAPQHRASRLLLLELYVNDGEYRAADSLAAEGQQLSPQDPTWPRLRAQVAAQAGETSAAVGHWRNVLAVSANASHLAGMVSFLLEQEMYTEALNVLGEHESLLSQFAMLEALRGRALAGTGQNDAAEAAFAAALGAAQNPGQLGSVAASMMQTWDASGAIDRLQTLESDLSPVKRQLAAAQIEIASGQYEQASDRLQTMTSELEQAEQPVRVFGMQLLATALHQGGAHAEARQVYEQVLEAAPEDVAALNNLAFLLATQLGEPESALPLAERATELAPQNARVLDTLGWTQYKMGLHEQARATLEQALAIEPLAPTYLHLGTLHHELGNTEQAQELLTEAVTLAERSGDQTSLEQANELLARIAGSN
ncbi:tetratricopeptide repeat protein [Phycisphaerales bacterium AB-hyl4]|uniref:Tetratricopeptide repeat protein n=1 Tax=Natronomicrosphaera hydrolytica TaxID=3242702 RepID=A0ABV4U1Q1_9BACT